MWKNLSTTKGSLFLLFSLFIVFGYAQDIKPCGTPPVKTKWFKKYIQERSTYRTAEDTLLYVPLRIHSVGTDEGAGHMRVDRILDALCRLNLDYTETAIQFYIEGEIDSINNSAYNSHENVLIGAEMMFEHNFSDAINIYFVSDPAGNCGYNLPYAGIAMGKGCSGPNSHTFAHEVGHNLSVQHPHLGWDGNEYISNEETPLTLTYDYTYFKDTLILDTLIIDTSIVEFADGSNCEIAGDFLCDTGPDYLSYRWPCNNDQESTVLQKDPNGIQFRSEGIWIMSYSMDNCSEAFSEEQIDLMRANLLDEKTSYLFKEDPLPQIVSEVGLIIPEEDEILDYRDVEFAWEAIQDAEYYILQISWLPNFGIINYEAHVTSNSYLFDLEVDRTYYYRVRAYNRYTYCTGFSSSSFETAELTATAQLDEDLFKLFPSISQNSDELTILGDRPIDEVRIINSSGVNIAYQGLYNENSTSSTVKIQDYEAGVYFMQIYSSGNVYTKKFLVQ